jgi:methionyl-tRNA formyltransferase
MIEKETVPISENMTFGELEEKMLQAACLALDRAIRAFAEGRVVKEVQDEKATSYAAKLLPSEEKIDWNLPVDKLHNIIRSLSPAPGAWCMIRIGDQDKRLKIKKTRIRRDLSGKPGQILLLTKESLVVGCGPSDQEGAIEILEVQLEGKKTLPTPEFLRGLANTSFSFLS